MKSPVEAELNRMKCVIIIIIIMTIIKERII